MRRVHLLTCLVSLALGMVIPPALWASDYTVRSPGLTVNLSRDGKIVAATLGDQKTRWNVLAETALAGCAVEGRVGSARLANGGVRFKKNLSCGSDGNQHRVELEETFLPTANSVRWELELKGEGPPWSTPIATRFAVPDAPAKRFWTAWGDPRPDDDPPLSWISDPSWQDPLVPSSFSQRLFWYGAAYYKPDRPRLGAPQPFRDIFCIPLATIVDGEKDIGLSAVLSPEDVTIELTLETSPQGEVTFSRLFRRIAEGKPVRFSLDLLAHEGDWRGGMRWVTARYPGFFNPDLASAERLAGTAAYSSYAGPLDVDKLKKMAFTVNWAASFDFPYQGMFIPPVPDDQEWPRGYPQSQSPPFDLTPTTSIRRMRDYSRQMRALGFDVLNYYNVGEFGLNLVYPPPPRKAQSDADLWKDPNDLLQAKFTDALLPRPEGLAPTPGGPEQNWPYFMAGKSTLVLDCGEPSWGNFLLDQARKLIEKLPDSAGMAIDRLDWTRLYNFQRDDGVTWYNGPARSGVWSWEQFMEKLAAIQHGSGQVIYLNNLVSRIDLLKHGDGLFSELAHWGGNLNTTALSSVSKPAIAWVFSKYTLEELARQRPQRGGDIGWVFGDETPTAVPDAFLQKFLYLGLIPMAPYPQNDHSLLPDARTEQFFMDYAPMFTALRGRRWVLSPRAISVDGAKARVNLFKVPAGYVIPVTLTGDQTEATVTVRGLPELVAGKTLGCELIHPGETQWKPCESSGGTGTLTLKVPLHRGCAMVRLRT